MNLRNNWTTGESFTATDQNAVADAVNNTSQWGLHGDMPAAAFSGRLYFCTDTDAVYRDNGTAWVRVKFGQNGHAGFPPPPSSGWTTTALNAGTTIKADKDSRLIDVVPAGGDNWRAEYRPLTASSGYTITAYIEYAGTAQQSTWQGLLLRNSSTGQLISFGFSFGYSGGDTWMLSCMKWNNSTSFNADYFRTSLAGLIGGGLAPWLRIRDDGAGTRWFEYSQNGDDWSYFTKNSRTDFFTADQWGWGINANYAGGNNNARMRARHLRQA